MFREKFPHLADTLMMMMNDVDWNHKSDNPSSIKQEKSPEEKASWFSFLFFFHLDGLFAIGYQKPLELSDLGEISTQNRTELVYKRFEYYFIEEKKLPAHQRSLWTIVLKTIGYEKLIFAVFLFGIYSTLSFGPVYILNTLVKH